MSILLLIAAAAVASFGGLLLLNHHLAWGWGLWLGSAMLSYRVNTTEIQQEARDDAQKMNGPIASGDWLSSVQRVLKRSI